MRGRPRLGRLERRKDVPRLIAALRYRDIVTAADGARADFGASVREGAALALGRIGDPQATEPLVEALHDESFRVRSAAVAALASGGEPAAAAGLAAAAMSWTAP